MAHSSRGRDHRQPVAGDLVAGEKKSVKPKLQNSKSRTATVKERPPERACRICGCLEHAPCILPGGEPCTWAAEDLCSSPICQTISDLEVKLEIMEAKLRSPNF